MKKDISLENDELKIEIKGKPPQSLRVIKGWTDWMIKMADIRDIIIAIDDSMVDELFKSLTLNFRKIDFSKTGNIEEYSLSKEKKIVRRVGRGKQRKEYQTIAIFIKNEDNQWPPPPIKISAEELSKIMTAFVTLNKPKEYCIKDSLRNYQYLLSILWMKKTDAKMLKGQRKLSARDIFRLGIP